MPGYKQDGDKWGHRPSNGDEMVAEFEEIPTVHRSQKKSSPAEVRKVLLGLVSQCMRAGMSRDEIRDIVKSVDPHSWNAKE
jgi:hypothetical protein